MYHFVFISTDPNFSWLQAVSSYFCACLVIMIGYQTLNLMLTAGFLLYSLKYPEALFWDCGMQLSYFDYV